ncbi:MAG: tRNA 2-selenouridine(34) synthase MnmH [Pseudomonadota bacterium]
MAVTFTALAQILDHGFDDIIDVRAPAEWAEDHIPGAVSLPVLDDEERARVGTIYKQVNPFTARKLGAALVAQNAARHLQGPLADKPGGWRPLVYCWRGGQRSGSFASILSQIGWRVETIAGGYKSYRALVVDRLYGQAFPSPVVLLDGNTGSAKTVLLQMLGARGVQVIDLEGLARHRGSLFGGMTEGQPTQKAFEDPARPVVIEAESSRIGQSRVPVSVWKAMLDAPRIEIAAPLSARAQFLVTRYPDLVADTDQLRSVIASLRRLQPAERLAEWQGLAEARDHVGLAEGLMTHHYDPRYRRNRDQGRVPVARLDLDVLDDAALSQAADNLSALIAQISGR